MRHDRRTGRAHCLGRECGGNGRECAAGHQGAGRRRHSRKLKAAGDYKAYFADRARQCRSWAADLRAGHRIEDEDIVGGLIEFETLAL